MSFDPYEFDRSYVPVGQRETLSQYTVKTFWWMFLGLAVTFGVALAGYLTQAIWYVFLIPAWEIVLLVAELAVVFVLVGRLERLSVPAARAMFFLYAALTGVVFSAYFLLFGVASVIFTFAATALYFGVVAAYGYFTKTDLSSLRGFLTVSLVFLLIYALISWFIPVFGFVDWVISLVGIGVFMAFTAYDTQKIKSLYYYYSGNEQMLQRASVYAALQLYLDFINLFVYLLRFMGRSRD